MIITESCKNLDETALLAHRLSQTIRDIHKPIVILLKGDLGAGKTAFVRCFAAEWGLDREVSSPTFTLMNRYENAHIRISHFDLYRLGSPEEAEELGLTDFIATSDVVFVEWPDVAQDWLESPDVEMSIKLGATETERIFHLKIYNPQFKL